jgi:hypothetical protein
VTPPRCSRRRSEPAGGSGREHLRLEHLRLEHGRGLLSDQPVVLDLESQDQRLELRYAVAQALVLETLVLRLQVENDRLIAEQATAVLEAEMLEPEMLPA